MSVGDDVKDEPFFEQREGVRSPQNVSALIGKTAFLSCIVRNLGKAKSVSNLTNPCLWVLKLPHYNLWSWRSRRNCKTISLITKYNFKIWKLKRESNIFLYKTLIKILFFPCTIFPKRKLQKDFKKNAVLKKGSKKKSKGLCKIHYLVQSHHALTSLFVLLLLRLFHTCCVLRLLSPSLWQN